MENIFRGQRIEGRIIFRRGQIFPCCGFRVKNSFSLRVSWWKGLSDSTWWNTYLEDRGWRGGLFSEEVRSFPAVHSGLKTFFSLGVRWWMCLSESIWWNTYLEERMGGRILAEVKSSLGHLSVHFVKAYLHNVTAKWGGEGGRVILSRSKG